MIPELLKQKPDFRRLWTGQTVSLFGDQISIIAVPLLAVLVLHADAAQMGFLTATMLAPNLLFSLHFGSWIDRFGHRRRAMIGADLGRISAPEPPTAPAGRKQLLAGLRFIRRTPLLLASLTSTATINFFNFAFFALFVLYATSKLHVSPAVLGFVLGAGAVGGILGSFYAGRIVERIGIGPVFVLGSFLFPAPLILVPLAGGAHLLILAMLFLAEFGSGFGVMLLDIAAGAIRQALVPDQLRARVSGAYMVINNGVRPLGSLLGGALATWLGLRPALWIATVGAVLGVLFLLPSPAPRLKGLPPNAREEEVLSEVR